MFKNQTILRRLGISFGLMLGLLLVCAGVGIVGLNILHSTARHVISIDEELAQHAARIDILLLNERRCSRRAMTHCSCSLALLLCVWCWA